MSGHTVEYRIISHVEWQDTEDDVNKLLKDGWELHGELRVIGDNPNHYVQALVRKEYSEYGNDQSIWLDGLDGTKDALEKIAEAIDDVGTNLAHVANAIGANPEENK